MSEAAYPDIVFVVGTTKFAVSSEKVQTISQLKGVFGDYQIGNENRGMMELNGTVLTLLDMRVIFGMTSQKIAERDFVETVDKAKTAHKSWVDELERYVRDRDEFCRAMDGHSCEFGKWYDSYRTDNQYLKRTLAKIKRPHDKLHEQARIIQKKIQDGAKDEELLAVYQRAKDLCRNQILPLLDELVSEYLDVEREMVLVMNHGGQLLGFVVDSISHIGELTPLEDNMQHTSAASIFTRGVSRDEDGELVLVLDEDQILQIYDEQ